MADLWLQIRPGTDVALMLGWIRLIIEEDLYDHDFVENWTVGFEELKAAAEAYTPEKVSEITGIPAALIRKSVRMYATTKPAVLPWGTAWTNRASMRPSAPGHGPVFGPSPASPIP